MIVDLGGKVSVPLAVSPWLARATPAATAMTRATPATSVGLTRSNRESSGVNEPTIPRTIAANGTMYEAARLTCSSSTIALEAVTTNAINTASANSGCLRRLDSRPRQSNPAIAPASRAAMVTVAALNSVSVGASSGRLTAEATMAAMEPAITPARRGALAVLPVCSDKGDLHVSAGEIIRAV